VRGGCGPTSPTSATPASPTSSRSSPRAAASTHPVLDSYQGAAAADSTVATQLGQITREIAEHKDAAGYTGTAAKLRVAANVFGAA